jgi:hypothetical protein
MEPSARLTSWVERHFDDPPAVLAVLGTLPAAVVGGQDVERIQASLVISTGGDWGLFQRQLAWAQQDWRDALVSSGLGNADWPAVLDEVLGAP